MGSIVALLTHVKPASKLIRISSTFTHMQRLIPRLRYLYPITVYVTCSASVHVRMLIESGLKLIWFISGLAHLHVTRLV